MSRRNSASVLEMPGTPLLDPANGHENPFTEEADTTRSGEDEEVQDQPAASPTTLDSNHLDLAVRRKKKFACAGTELYGGLMIRTRFLMLIICCHNLTSF